MILDFAVDGKTQNRRSNTDSLEPRQDIYCPYAIFIKSKCSKGSTLFIYFHFFNSLQRNITPKEKVWKRRNWIKVKFLFRDLVGHKKFNNGKNTCFASFPFFLNQIQPFIYLYA